MIKYVFVSVVSLIIGFCIARSCEQKKTNYVANYNIQKQPYMDSIEILNSRISILKRQKSNIILRPHKELVTASIVKDTICQPVINGLLEEVSKRDAIIDMDSLERMNLEKQVLIHSTADSVFAQKLEMCQAELDDSNKEIGRLEKKGKGKNAIIAILGAIILVALIF